MSYIQELRAKEVKLPPTTMISFRFCPLANPQCITIQDGCHIVEVVN